MITTDGAAVHSRLKADFPIGSKVEWDVASTGFRVNPDLPRPFPRGTVIGHRSDGLVRVQFGCGSVSLIHPSGIRVA